MVDVKLTGVEFLWLGSVRFFKRYLPEPLRKLFVLLFELVIMLHRLIILRSLFPLLHCFYLRDAARVLIFIFGRVFDLVQPSEVMVIVREDIFVGAEGEQ